MKEFQKKNNFYINKNSILTGNDYNFLPFGETIFKQIRCDKDNSLLFKYFNNMISIKCKSCKKIHYIELINNNCVIY